MEKQDKQTENQNVVLEVRKSHKDSILCLENFKDNNSSDVSPYLFFSGSEDKGVRLWDLRTGGAVKLFQSPELESSMGSLIHGPKTGKLYVANSSNIFCFDLRNESPIIKTYVSKFNNQGDEPDQLDINSIILNRSETQLSFVDDQ